MPGFVSTTVSLSQDMYAELDFSLGAHKDAIATPLFPLTEVEYEGCATLNGGFSVNAGADGPFFDIFNNDTVVSIVKEDDLLLQVGG